MILWNIIEIVKGCVFYVLKTVLKYFRKPDVSWIETCRCLDGLIGVLSYEDISLHVYLFIVFVPVSWILLDSFSCMNQSSTTVPPFTMHLSTELFIAVAISYLLHAESRPQSNCFVLFVCLFVYLFSHSIIKTYTKQNIYTLKHELQNISKLIKWIDCPSQNH